MTRNLASHIVDIGATVPPLDSYRFLSTAGTATIKGYFVNQYGQRTGSSFSDTVNTSEAETFTDMAGSVPSDAVGFRGVFSVACYYDISLDETDFEANPSRYPVIPASADVRIGRVA